MKLQNLLEQLLEEDIDEAAIPVSQASEEQLALLIDKGGKEDGYVMLYNPSIVITGFEQASKQYGPTIPIRKVMEEALEEHRAILGYLAFGPASKNSSFYTVNLSGAERGYGPTLLYDVALSTIYPKGLTSDRHSVSKSAQRIWSHYYENREDVDRQLLEGAEDIKQYGKVVPTVCAGGGNLRAIVQDYSECEKKISRFKSILAQAKMGMNISSEKAVEAENIVDAGKKELLMIAADYKEAVADNPLAYQYTISSPLSISSLIERHEKFLRWMRRYHISSEQVNGELAFAGDSFARNKIE